MLFGKNKTNFRQRNRCPSINWDESYIKRRELAQRKEQSEPPAAAYLLAKHFRRVRQTRRENLTNVASKTLVKQRFLEAIEEGKFSELPGGIYLKNYFHAYARYLHIDKSVVHKAFSPSPVITTELGPNFTSNEVQSVYNKTYGSRLPKVGEYLLYIILSKPERINVIGDLEEDFETVRLKFGEWAARVFFYKQVLTSLLPFTVKSFLRSLFEP